MSKFILLTSSLILILSNVALLLTLAHFLWTFSEVHAKMVALLWLVMVVAQFNIRMSLNSKGDN